MKKVILAILFLASFATFSFAQNADAAAVPKKPKFEWSAETMNSAGIAADVQTKITDLIKAAEEAIKPLRKNKELTDEDRKAQIKVIRDKCNKDIQALLTPEQVKKIADIRKALK
jgi:Spy/CpxP family protein refolding chaperone